MLIWIYHDLVKGQHKGKDVGELWYSRRNVNNLEYVIDVERMDNEDQGWICCLGNLKSRNPVMGS